MSQYAIIKLGGKQYVVKEGENLLVDRLDREEGKTFQPDVLFLGGNGAGELAPKSPVTAKVLGHVRGPKIRIGKYKPKEGLQAAYGLPLGADPNRSDGHRRQAGRSESGAAPAPKEKEKAPVAEAPKEKKAPVAEAPKGLPKGYAEMTVALISEGAKSWNRPMLEAALAYEQEHAKRKGALAALESALAAKEG